MTRQQLQLLILKEYDILENGVPKKVEGDLWEYLDTLDEEDTSVVVLEDALKWNNEELAQVKIEW